MAKRVLVKHITEDNSIIVNCYDAKNILLMKKNEKSSHINNIVVNKLTNYCVPHCWDEYSQDKVGHKYCTSQ